MGRWIAWGFAFLTACSFDRSGGGGSGSNDGSPPPPGDAGEGDDAGSGSDGGADCATGALDFSPDAWVEVGDESLDLVNDFTVEAWARPRAVTDEYHLVSRHDDNGSEGYVLMIKDGVPEFRVYFPDDSGPPSECDCKNSEARVATDEWVHLAGSYASGAAYLFSAGELIATCNCEDLCGDGCTGDLAGFGGPLTLGIEASRLDRFAADGYIDDAHVRASRRTTSFDPLQAASCAADSLLLFRFEAPVGQELTSACGAAATGRLGSEAGADLNDPTAVETDCPPK